MMVVDNPSRRPDFLWHWAGLPLDFQDIYRIFPWCFRWKWRVWYGDLKAFGEASTVQAFTPRGEK